ncbi:translation initiation factor IF-1 [Candidatus Shapirobacteria bacterium CG_4_8_14_3_um_filter_35_11]|uniref:Translation initiation factor IF-1 n=3 Tax=Candidatus Shapironibacteriota TaxID=1752721 RepID=A0A2M7XNL9_9BACT|nr:MAG: translation initiation factor IF-1 [Candidatus Shapirobacteria bacterium CG_4_10_14_3_um_filter_35_13]PJA51167.1 MAG: translation initiation factor IF-1 [Candidatus Shapirobacteria bacterium CG_4_9_14_3_um_filter_36_12]PJC81120.1 MAG: translation initiation factor IF-1 [Candidatus Shapirobacteria bacterium CG_4_8_14_3_um_filter_35_11]
MKDITIKGLVTEVLPDQLFHVKLEDDKLIVAYLAGRLRLHHIRCLTGDTVSLVLSPDGNKGRIVYRG